MHTFMRSHTHTHTHTHEHMNTYLAQFSYFISLGYTSLPQFSDGGRKKDWKITYEKMKKQRTTIINQKLDQHLQTTSHLTFHRHIKIGQGSCLWVHTLCIHMTRLHGIEEIGRHTYVITAHIATRTS